MYRTLLIWGLVVGLCGCSSRGAMHRYLDEAYEAYGENDCNRTLLALSRAERQQSGRRPLQAEISLLRGQCLERQALYPDAGETYRFIQTRYPDSEYAFRAGARLQTLEVLGHYPLAPDRPSAGAGAGPEQKPPAATR